MLNVDIWKDNNNVDMDRCESFLGMSLVMTSFMFIMNIASMTML